MSYKYFPHTDDDLQQMMQRVGISSLDDLYAEVPEAIRFRGDYDLPDEMSETEVRQVFEQLGAMNRPMMCFGGAGVYDHYTPAVIPNLLSRSELLTSYTPYQAEISQGTLHYIFEYQSMMAAASGKKQNRFLVSDTVNPKTLQVMQSYAHYHGIQLGTVASRDGVTDREDLERQLAEGGVAGVLVQQPNYFGIVEDYSGFADLIHTNKGLFVIDSIAADLALLKTPGEWGADIAVGDAQSLGIPMQFGGPYVGYLCCTEKLLRKMPGRIVGLTQDNRGQRAFVLTLQAREQHIRRQKATSNICSNQSLMALFVTIYLSLMGKEGLREAAQLSYAGAHYLCDQLIATGRFQLVYQQPFFNEFVVRYDGDLDGLLQCLSDEGIFGGVKVADDQLMIAVTEQRTKSDIDRLVSLINL